MILLLSASNTVGFLYRIIGGGFITDRLSWSIKGIWYYYTLLSNLPRISTQARMHEFWTTSRTMDDWRVPKHNTLYFLGMHYISYYTNISGSSSFPFARKPHIVQHTACLMDSCYTYIIHQLISRFLFFVPRKAILLQAFELRKKGSTYDRKCVSETRVCEWPCIYHIIRSIPVWISSPLSTCALLWWLSHGVLEAPISRRRSTLNYILYIYVAI